jgi:ribosomal protein S21
MYFSQTFFKLWLYLIYMLKVEINKNIGLEKALKILKGKVIKTKQNEELRKRTEYVKKTTQKREKMKKAKFKQSIQLKTQS